MTDAAETAEHHSKHDLRAREDDIPSESKKTDRSAISEMKARSWDEITHLLQTAGEMAELSSTCCRQRVDSKITHILRRGHGKVVIISIAAGSS